MYSDLAPRRGVRAAFSPNNRYFWGRVGTLIALAKWAFVLWALYHALGFFAGFLSSPPILEFRPCLPELAPDEFLVRRMNLTDRVLCSSRWQAIPQPCVCCVHGDCWRDVKILSNGTQMVTMEDDVDDPPPERRLARRIPRTMNVCYMGVGETAFKTCLVEENEKVGDILRAIEFMRGWAASGEDVTPAPS